MRSRESKSSVVRRKKTPKKGRKLRVGVRELRELGNWHWEAHKLAANRNCSMTK